jgi:hypothetical protein
MASPYAYRFTKKGVKPLDSITYGALSAFRTELAFLLDLLAGYAEHLKLPIFSICSPLIASGAAVPSSCTTKRSVAKNLFETLFSDISLSFSSAVCYKT